MRRYVVAHSIVPDHQQSRSTDCFPDLAVWRIAFRDDLFHDELNPNDSTDQTNPRADRPPAAFVDLDCHSRACRAYRRLAHVRRKSRVIISVLEELTSTRPDDSIALVVVRQATHERYLWALPRSYTWL